MPTKMLLTKPDHQYIPNNTYKGKPKLLIDYLLYAN
jgi:hypothetical protein